MEDSDVLDELKAVLVTRLRFDPRRVADVSRATPLPRGIDGSLGLDSLDFIELSLAIEERFGVVMEDTEDVVRHFASLDALCRFVAERGRPA